MLPVVARISQDARITTKQLAETLSLTTMAINRYSRGIRRPGFAEIVAAVKKYDLDILRYIIADEEAAEISDRGFGKYILDLERGIYIDHEILLALTSRDWTRVKQIHEAGLVKSMVNEIWAEAKEDRRLNKWGRDASDAAERAYYHFEDEKWDGFLKEDVLAKLSRRFAPAYRISGR